MEQQRTTGAVDDFSRVSTVKRVLPEHVRAAYRNEMKPLVTELHARLPRLRGCASPAQYAAERAEVMVLTACFCDDTLDLYALEALLQQLKGHRRVFATALGEPPGTA